MNIIHFYIAFLLLIIPGANGTTVRRGDKNANKNAGKRKAKQKMAYGGGNRISGAYIVQLADDIQTYQVKRLAENHAYIMRDEVTKLVANGTLSILSDTQVTTGPIFTTVMKGFTLTGVPDELASSLLTMTGVIGVEQDAVIALDDPLYVQSETQGGYADISGTSSCPEIVPWGIARVGGPLEIDPSSLGKVFVIDTGIFPNADLSIDTALSTSFVNDGTSPAWSDGAGHGTHVAGTIGAIKNCMGVVGVVPGATVVSVRVLDRFGSGTVSAVIKGVDYVAANGQDGDVANLSLGNGNSSLLDSAVLNASLKGIKFAIAAGNSAIDACNSSPARVNGENIYTVSAYNQLDEL